MADIHGAGSAGQTATTLDMLPIGSSAQVRVVGGEGSLRQHFLDMGIIPGVRLTMVKHAPLGDPVEVRLHSYELTLRLADARQILVADVQAAGAAEEQATEEQVAEDGRPQGRRRAHDRQRAHDRRRAHDRQRVGTGPAAPTALSEADHPGLGEGGRFHDKATENPLPEGTQITFALAGNQNSGKTTLFNQITGANQHVGNFPGVTVDRKDGSIKGHPMTTVTDLPGIYSMSPYSEEELVTRQFLLDDKPCGIIDIVDATNIERNLYLTMQLMELGIPMVLALNMMDEMEGNGGSVDVNEMERMLGIPVVPISAAKGEGISELVDHALHVARFQETPVKQDFCSPDDNGGAVHRCLHAIMSLVEDHAERARIPLRFAASKLAEGDGRVLEALKLDQNEREMLEHIVVQMEDERGLDRSAAIADMRFAFIDRVCRTCVTKPHKSRERTRSERIDRVLTGKWTSIPAFVAIMGLVFWLTFNVVGAWLSDLVADGVDSLGALVAGGLGSVGVNPVLQSLVMDGIFTGVGTVLSFLPYIVILFIFLSILEDSGYMARVAFVMDKLLRRIGLSGRSIVPMLIGFGCSVPAVMSSRTLPSERDRKMTIMLIPYMSCSAKLPIYAFFSAAFFPDCAGLVMVGLYFGGIVVGVVVALLMRGTLFAGEAVPFVMELPNYRLPSARSVFLLAWDKAKDFLQRAFTIIFAATLVIWFLQTFDFGLNVVDDSSASILAVVAGWITPVFAPLGFADWRISTALVSGFMAKESVVSTVSVLYGSVGALTGSLTPLAALSLLFFCLLYTPCVAAVTSVRRELGRGWALGMVAMQCVVAWLVALLVRGVGLAVTGSVGDPVVLASALLLAALVAALVVGARRQRTAV